MLLLAQRCGPAPLAPEFGWLSDAERARAGAFRRVSVRNEFITGRRLARLAVARLLGVEPHLPRFRLSGTGQPLLCPRGMPGDGHFSIAHSHGLVLCAASSGCRVGVDVEPCSRAGELRGLERRYLTRGERRDLEALRPALRQSWMLRRWVDKEACSKALGRGLQIAFDATRIEEHDAHRASFVSDEVAGERLLVHRWHPRLESGYQISVVCEAGASDVPGLEVLDLGSTG